MGIDAEMFVRLRGKKRLDENQVRELSYKLCSTVGSDAFWFDEKENQHALEIIKPEDGQGVVWIQDGPNIKAAGDEQFIRVNWLGRYYGPNYERGDFLVIYGTAIFLERHTGGEVWYGGDSSGVCAKPFTAPEREQLLDHWLQNGGRPYRHHELPEFPHRSINCDFCGGVRMINSGGGRGDDYLTCDGCGKKIILMRDGTVHELKRHEDFFKAHDRLSPPAKEIEI